MWPKWSAVAGHSTNLVSHHMETSTNLKLRRGIAGLLGVGALLIFIVTYFAFPDTNQKIGAVLVFAIIACSICALFPSIHPGQAQWDASDQRTPESSSQAQAADQHEKGNRDG